MQVIPNKQFLTFQQEVMHLIGPLILCLIFFSAQMKVGYTQLNVVP